MNFLKKLCFYENGVSILNFKIDCIYMKKFTKETSSFYIFCASFNIMHVDHIKVLYDQHLK